MSDTDVEAEEESGKKGKKGTKGGKSKLIPAVIIAIGLGVGGYFMGPGSSSAEAAGPTTTEAPVPGEIATIEPININLADGHFLRVGLALQLVEGTLKADFEKGENSKANDLIISELGGAKMDELATADGRSAMKERLKKKMKKTYDGVVLDIYFTEFVMQ